MPRELTSHMVNGLNQAIKITAEDEPGHGGACHEYLMVLEPSADGSCKGAVKIKFQNGPIGQSGFNGWSMEALLAIVEDRLKSFQAGPSGCRENAIALTKIQEAMHWMHHRTRDRMARGVEGTSEK